MTHTIVLAFIPLLTYFSNFHLSQKSRGATTPLAPLLPTSMGNFSTELTLPPTVKQLITLTCGHGKQIQLINALVSSISEDETPDGLIPDKKVLCEVILEFLKITGGWSIISFLQSNSELICLVATRSGTSFFN